MKSTDRAISLAIIFITFAGLMLWDWYTPVSADDWAYLTIPQEGDEPAFWMCDGPRIGNLSDALDATSCHYGMINGRLANIFLFFMAPYPRTVAGVLGGLMASLLFFLVILISGKRQGRWLPTVLSSVVLVWVGLPWYDYMQSMAFQTNYIWSSVAVLAVMWLWNRNAATWLMAVAGFVAGWMHEGFAAVLIAWSLGHALVAEDKAARHRALVVLAFAVAGFAVNLAGGTFERPAKQTDYFRYETLSGLVTTMASQMWMLYVVIAIGAYKLLHEPTNSKVVWFRKHFPVLLAIATGAVMPFVIVKFDRVVWPMDLMCILFVVSPLASMLCRIPRNLFTVMSVLFVAAYGWWMVELCVWEKKISSEQDAAVGELTRRRDAGEPFSPLIYVDYTPDDSIPSWLMGVVRQPLTDYWSGPRMAASFTRGYADVVPLPASLRNLPFEEWPAVRGDNTFRGHWPHLLSPPLDFTGVNVEVTAGPPDSNMPLIDRMIVSLGEGLHPYRKTIVAECWPQNVRTPWGDTLTVLGVRPLPRTFRHRPIENINLTR